jgi:hypothetical protein
MSQKRGRPEGVGNRKYRVGDHQDCLTIARLRLTNPSLSIWDAVFQVTGDGDGVKWHSARQRRVHNRYKRFEGYYVTLIQAAARPKPETAKRHLITAAEHAEMMLYPLREFLTTFEALAQQVRSHGEFHRAATTATRWSNIW